MPSTGVLQLRRLSFGSKPLTVLGVKATPRFSREDPNRVDSLRESHAGGAAGADPQRRLLARFRHAAYRGWWGPAWRMR